MPRTVLTDVIPEKSTWRYNCTLTKEDGTALAAAQLTTLTLTLYNQDASLTILNACSADSILNAGRGTVDSSGNLAIVFATADNYLVDTSQDVEHHVALIQATYSSGTKASRHEVEFTVKNLYKVA